MADRKAVLIEGTELNDDNIDEMAAQVAEMLFGDAEEGNEETTSPEE